MKNLIKYFKRGNSTPVGEWKWLVVDRKTILDINKMEKSALLKQNPEWTFVKLKDGGGEFLMDELYREVVKKYENDEYDLYNSIHTVFINMEQKMLVVLKRFKITLSPMIAMIYPSDMIFINDIFICNKIKIGKNDKIQYLSDTVVDIDDKNFKKRISINDIQNLDNILKNDITYSALERIHHISLRNEIWFHKVKSEYEDLIKDMKSSNVNDLAIVEIWEKQKQAYEELLTIGKKRSNIINSVKQSLHFTINEIKTQTSILDKIKKRNENLLTNAFESEDLSTDLNRVTIQIDSKKELMMDVTAKLSSSIETITDIQKLSELDLKMESNKTQLEIIQKELNDLELTTV
jgi:hypothetical protein